VQNGQQGSFVYVVDDDSTVHLRPVQVGIATETSSQILSGLKDGERVVVDGTDRLIEGATVRVRKPGELENPPGYDPGAGGNKRGGSGKRDGKFKKGDGDFKSPGNFKKGQGGGFSQ
jgi:multidrug efflux system membrane fusion protein